MSDNGCLVCSLVCRAACGIAAYGAFCFFQLHHFQLSLRRFLFEQDLKPLQTIKNELAALIGKGFFPDTRFVYRAFLAVQAAGGSHVRPRTSPASVSPCVLRSCVVSCVHSLRVHIQKHANAHAHTPDRYFPTGVPVCMSNWWLMVWLAATAATQQLVGGVRGFGERQGIDTGNVRVCVRACVHSQVTYAG